MQDRYVGDIGDFGKYGLLRKLFGYPGILGSGCGLRLSVAWYLFPDESHTSDGKFTDYPQLRSCDPSLFDELKRLVDTNNRNVAAVRQSGILPDDTMYYERRLFYSRQASWTLRQATRQDWLDGALEATEGTDVIFIDPDNGISQTTARFRKNGPKYVFMDDLHRFYIRGQSLIIYHHSGRRGKALEQIQHLSKRLQQELSLLHLPRALWWHRVSARFYFIVPRPEHEAALKSRLDSFVNSPWKHHFQLVES